MERRFSQRVREIEKQINEEKRKRKEEWIETQAYWRPQARFHAAAVAAIVLRGNQRSMNRSNVLGCALWSDMEST